MLEEKITALLDHLSEQGIEITGETAFICNDGVLLVVPNERGAVDLMLVRNPVKVDFNLGITDKDMELWNTTAQLLSEMEDNE